jgi:glycosyltransferase involved in cell wall biosynthesis
MEGFPVSVVIPVRDEEASLQGLADSLRSQTVRPSEIIIVNGGSTDNTLVVANAIASATEGCRVIDAGESTPGRGRNQGIAAARNEWVALIDAGITADVQWLERLIEVADRDESVTAVYGNYEPVVDSFFTRCASLVYVPAKQRRGDALMRGPCVASMLLRRDVWKDVGGFPDLRASEDLIFLDKIERLGTKIGWAPTATVRWHLQPTLSRTFKKFVVYSRYNVWAGRQRFWHYGVGRQYLAAMPFAFLSLFHSAWWLLVPMLGLVLRIATSIWRRREGRGMLWALNLPQFLLVGVIMLTIDLATFAGWTQALVQAPLDQVN